MYYWGMHIDTNWRIQPNHPRAAAMRPYVKYLWPLVIIISEMYSKDAGYQDTNKDEKQDGADDDDRNQSRVIVIVVILQIHLIPASEQFTSAHANSTSPRPYQTASMRQILSLQMQLN